ncbi:hypothetical protein ACOMHN_016449 [Nucella lapillus]
MAMRPQLTVWLSRCFAMPSIHLSPFLNSCGLHTTAPTGFCRVEVEDQDERRSLEAEPEVQDGLVGALARALVSRRLACVDSEEEGSSDDDDDDDDDDEWDD